MNNETCRQRDVTQTGARPRPVFAQDKVEEFMEFLLWVKEWQRTVSWGCLAV